MLKAAQKRRLYPSVLCYHGGAAGRDATLTFRETPGDLKAHVMTQQRAGYRFVLPSDYLAWLRGEKSYSEPVCCIHFDDCLDTLNMLIPWLIANGVPSGIAVVSRRLGKYDAEQGYARWSKVNEWVQTGLVELMSHTHNLHNLTLVQTEELAIDGAPVLEGPCWIDDGDVVYRAAGDARWYWDFSHVDTITLGIPLFGTDPYDGTTKVETTLTITPKVTGSVTLLRLWMALSKPSGSGYPVSVEIRHGSSLVWAGTISPKEYETRSQWVEREFFTVELDTPFNVTAGVAFTLEFKTLNTGAGVALLYALATDDDTAFRAVTNCQGLFPEGSQGWPFRYWQYIDYPANDRWPVIPCLILGFGTGRMATEAEYTSYITADCQALNTSIATWLGAQWSEVEVWTAPIIKWDDEDQWDYYGEYYGILYLKQHIPIGWLNPDKVVAVVPLTSPTTVTVDFLRIKVGQPEFFVGGDADPYMLTTTQAVMDEAANRSYPATFRFEVGDTATGPWTYVGDGAIWRIARNEAIDLSPFTLTAGVTRYVRITPINGGPTVGTEQRTRWPIDNIKAGYRTGTIPATLPDQIVYPFGAYYVGGTGEVQQKDFKDIGELLKGIFIANGIVAGYTIQAYRNVPFGEVREPDMRQTEWAIGRWLVYGDQALDVSLNNMAAYNGNLLPDVPHRGVGWQVSFEADRVGNATIRNKAQVLDYVAFDAWAFNGRAYYGEAAIIPYWCNDGGTYEGEVYPNDRAYLQGLGVKCLLIINNNLGTGEPDPDIGWDVVWHPETWVPLIVNTCLTGGWDGITCNLEAVPAASRDQATFFYRQLARAMHAAGLILHATMPAPTGTEYDEESWAGWCDHTEILKVVDGGKIMSYTESGEWSAPGPAAPGWFWTAVYDYLRRVVPAMYWPRIYCGCRAFGHIWYDDTPEENGYMTYHETIAEALTYGARIDIADTEIGWRRGTRASWCGTPLTVDRSQIEAEKSGFGGLGLWKLDDGDIDEFFPDWRTLGRYEDMSFIDTRFPPEISWGSSGGPVFNTVVNTAQNGDESRVSLWVMPLYEYDVSLRIQTQEEYEAVRDLFMVARGSARSFRFKDWADFRLTDTVIALGDGSTTNFQVVKGYAAGGESLVRNITKLVSGTIAVKVAGVAASPTIDHATGIVSFTTAPALGAEITVTGEFDVHVRFRTDSFPAEIVEWGDGAFLTPGTVTLREVRRA